MTDKRRHRGAHPDDERLFARGNWAKLARAVDDMSWLLSNGYADKSSLKLVGDRFALTLRQRMAVMRSACAAENLDIRKKTQVLAAEMANKTLYLDGYNVLTTIETALGGGVILVGRDGCLRDIAGVHGTYRKVEETVGAIELIGKYLDKLGVSGGRWYLDRPVSNSGRLRGLLQEIATEKGWKWQVELVYNPDEVLAQTSEVAATSDSEILNRCAGWLNLAAEVVNAFVSDAYIVNLSQRMDP